MSDKTLTGKTIEEILAYVKENNLKSGDKLPTETEFLDHLGISRIILREAFSYLKGLGLLESRRGSGFWIAEVSFTDALEQALEHISVIGMDHIDDLLELRSQLELGTIYKAVEQATPNDIETIQTALAHLEKVSATQPVSYSDYSMAELEFHQAIMQPAKCKSLNIVNFAIKKFFSSSLASQTDINALQAINLSQELLEHKMIAYAFELHWPDVAANCLRNHLSKQTSGNNRE